MKIEKDVLKKIALDAIDKRRETILSIGDSIYNEPELGYKEFKTAEKVKQVFESMGIPYEDKIGITGLKGKIKGKSAKYNVAVMGELDSVISPKHPDSDPKTGAAHCCGHNCMIAGIIGVAYALKETDIMESLSGDVSIMAIPAEEFVEIGYRNELIQSGAISFIGGKQEFIKLGAFDDVDVAIMQHTFSSENEGDSGIKAEAGYSANGFVGQEIQFIGKEAHAGSAPHAGVNALNAAMIALTAINAQRETFREKDYIRVHPIITRGGDLVNVIPSDVRLENYVRGANVEAILSATEKVTRSWHAGADAMGAKCIVNTLPGYFPIKPNENLQEIMYQNLKQLLGEANVRKHGEHSCGSSDVGDVASIVPTIHARIGGASGNFHSDDYRLVDRELAYLGAAKALTLCVIDLLYNEAQEAERVVEAFEPVYTKAEYLKNWGSIGEQFK
ncbi:amidohydrolase [Fusibacter ferrireducens]|uniref:Peptidase M20 domain-containing protein 2 n=1 Tax=Fusibacter ferrireducens TaxID=2785058 RepID=A0ABR9ZYM3_9FIRM|nr:amidohydrolase [Fusibacter ferrireducens]MBF4695542.1 amidohydrolase [Fusibacter ferrireducens]